MGFYSKKTKNETLSVSCCKNTHTKKKKWPNDTIGSKINKAWIHRLLENIYIYIYIYSTMHGTDIIGGGLLGGGLGALNVPCL